MTQDLKRVSEVDKYLGNVISEARVNKGLSRQEVAQQLNVTHQQLQKYEKGVNRISAASLFKLVKILDLNITELFEKQESENTELENLDSRRIMLELNRNLRKLDEGKKQALALFIKNLSKTE